MDAEKWIKKHGSSALFTFQETAQICVPWHIFSKHVVAAVQLFSISMYQVNNPAPLSLAFFLSQPITSSLLHPSLPRRPLRGRFYSVWITCPSWRWACWWGENLFPPVEPWFKALRSAWFWVIVSPVVMNQGSGRQQTCISTKPRCWYATGCRDWSDAFKTELGSINTFLGDFSFSAQR